MLQVATVAIEEARLIVDTAAARGVAPATLLAHAGLGPAVLEDSDGRLSRADFDRLLEEAVHLTKDSDFGLRAAERSDGGRRLPAALHYALTSCPTVGALFWTVSRYARLLHTDAEMSFVPNGGVAHLELDVPGSGAVARRHLAERRLGALVRLVRRNADAAFAPREVWFARPALTDTSAHERIFRAPLRFERAVDALVLGDDTLTIPVRDGDAGLQQVLEAHLAAILPEVEPAELAGPRAVVPRGDRGSRRAVRLDRRRDRMPAARAVTRTSASRLPSPRGLWDGRPKQQPTGGGP